MKLKKLLYIMIPAAIVIAFSAFYNVSGAAICLTGSLATNAVSGDTAFHASKSYSMANINNFKATLDQAITRVNDVLWKTTATPDIYILDGKKVFGLFTYNNYGSTISLPHKTCVLMGPNGHNVDVIAHETAHADLVDKLGFINYLKLPRWLDEGIAMQVDFRKDYDAAVLQGKNPNDVKAMQGAEFYKGNDAQVTQNYAAAKAVVQNYISINSTDKLLVNLRDNPSALEDEL